MDNKAEKPGVERARGILLALSRAAGVDQMVEVESVQVSGISYTSIGEPGLQFLEDWAGTGVRVCVPAFMNPAGMDLREWRRLGVPEEFACKQKRIVRALEQMGVQAELTCAPYHAENTPPRGAHLAWSESSAVSCANSVFGARTNREGGPSALAAAVTGWTPLSGYHLYRNRLATHLVEVRCATDHAADLGALGYLVGRAIGAGVPFFKGLSLPERVEPIVCLKALAAAMAASGAVALFHVEGITPEAKARNMLPEGVPRTVIEDLDEAYQRLNAYGGHPGEGESGPRLDLVWIGCPHASVEEVSRIASAVRGKSLGTRVWITASRQVRAAAERSGDLRAIEEAGAAVVCDTCMVVAPLRDMGIQSVATNSAKGAYYLPTHCKVRAHFGTLAQCVAAAVNGRWAGSVPPAEPATKTSIEQSRPNLDPMKEEPRVVVPGEVTAQALCSAQALGFFGKVDPNTGVVTDRSSDLHGKCVAGKVLVFPHGKGSTVGSYVIYALKRNGVAPAAIVTREAEPIVAAGAAIAGIPAVSGIDLSRIATGDRVRVRGAEVQRV